LPCFSRDSGKTTDASIARGQHAAGSTLNISIAGREIKHRKKKPKKIVLSHRSFSKTKTISQKHGLLITRIYTGDIMGKKDTLRQVITGTIDSIGDSLVYINASNIETETGFNHHNESVYPAVKPTITMFYFKDTLLAVPRNELYSITPQESMVIPGIIMLADFNIFATPFYATDYKTLEVNRTLFNRSILISVGVFIAGLIEYAALAPYREYIVKIKSREPDAWHMVSLR
jgi:hypothetical protein